MKITELKITKDQVSGNGPLILVEIREVYDYEGGEKTNRLLGYKYQVIAPMRKYESAFVKVESTAPIITTEELEETDTPILVDFEGFEGKFYKYNGDYAFSAKAKAIKIVSGKVGK